MKYIRYILISFVIGFLFGCSKPAIEKVLVSTDRQFFQEIYMLSDHTVVWAHEGKNDVLRQRFDFDRTDKQIDIFTRNGTHSLYLYQLDGMDIWVPSQVYLPAIKESKELCEEQIRSAYYYEVRNSGRLKAF